MTIDTRVVAAIQMKDSVSCDRVSEWVSGPSALLLHRQGYNSAQYKSPSAALLQPTLHYTDQVTTSWYSGVRAPLALHWRFLSATHVIYKSELAHEEIASAT